ncbi:hypothetical protein [Actinoplanes sp. L3-i22]|uniref:hypothetical protein n=1 Tax=Actinoplanes sp. L3-i22 TaxID=2836373 RepID=UPI001C73E4C6|nr:hypothetical protein [Actinoplanes sp. L3-i22]BCY07246.1 hypothetical protein L3i22_023340 [Actinoplanes sp. L3-i22]
MSDRFLEDGLDAYATQVQRTATMPAAAEIRRRGDRRRRNRATGAAFAAVLVAAAGVGATLRRHPDATVHPAQPPPSSSAITPSTATSKVTSDLTGLRRIGVDLDRGVLIDVADDGADLWMQIGAGDVVDFTGSVKDASTEMSLRAAPVTGTNRVVIVPVARPGECVADTPQVALTLKPCDDGDAAQIWAVVPAGDSGQFELRGEYGILNVDQKLVGSDQSGRTGLQTLPF